ncbi:MAG: hypothetical protein GXY05_12140, partial [Clostridiales bacterium]|nr:hypothetical protein [Clostridiales bacterium]
LTGAIATTDTGSSAVVLNAGKDTAAGTSTGGNIIVSGGSVTVGAGGRATLYSGDVSDSTGLTALVGSGSGNFRYNSDESVSNFSTPLGSGIYAVYREQVTTDAPLAPATPATENQTVDTVVMSLTSIQPSVNGTQETSSGDSGATSGSLPTEGGYAMGPGAGSGSIDMFSVFELIEDRTL